MKPESKSRKKNHERHKPEEDKRPERLEKSGRETRIRHTKETGERNNQEPARKLARDR